MQRSAIRAWDYFSGRSKIPNSRPLSAAPIIAGWRITVHPDVLQLWRGWLVG
jgi:hypothetical protein